MDGQPSALPPRPPGAVKAILSGFNVVAGNIGIILLPVTLDVFLWLGPRLTLSKLFAPVLKLIQETQASAGQAQALSQSVQDVANGFNMFSNLRTFPLGVFSLMLFNLSPNSPFGPRVNLEITNWFLKRKI